MPLTPDVIAGQVQVRVLYVPDDLFTVAAVYGTLFRLADPWYWTKYGTVTPDDIAYAMLEMVLESAENGNMDYLGTIIPIARGSVPVNMLACDGGIVDATNYQRLYNVLDGTYKIPPSLSFPMGAIQMPDLRGLVVIGTSGSHTFGSTGGEETHQLTVSELASHNHAESVASGTVISESPGAPAPSAVPSSGFTGNEGGDAPHNNMQPYIALTYCMIAR